MDTYNATEFDKVIANTVNETFAIMEHDLLFAGYIDKERIKKTYNDHIRTALEMAVGDMMDTMNKELYDCMVHKFGGYLAMIKKYFELVDTVAIFQMPEYKTANLLMRHTITEYIYNDTILVEYEQYENWRMMNGDGEDGEDGEDGMHGDDVDEYVREEYGEDADWCFMTCMDGVTVIDELPDFVVLDDEGNKEMGIAIIRRYNEDEEDEEDEDEKKDE